LKISELILRTIGSAGCPEADASHRYGVKIAPVVSPRSLPRLACPIEAVRRREAEAKRTISSFSLVANSF
jgi:hypothetical protein